MKSMGSERDTSNKLCSKTTTYLLQNCDLPPPTKLVSGGFMSSIGKIYETSTDEHTRLMYGDDDKVEILKALQRSQTRAMAAERNLRILSEDKAALSRMIVDDSMVLFAHRHWVNMLEIRVLKLERERREEEERERESCVSESEGRWCDCGAIALCFAIAGVGIAFTCRYYLF